MLPICSYQSVAEPARPDDITAGTAGMVVGPYMYDGRSKHDQTSTEQATCTGNL